VVFVSFLLAVRAVLALGALPPDARTLVDPVYTWFRVGDFHANVSFLLDPLSAVMILVVTGVGFLIHVYSVGYMAHDHSFQRFFLYLNLFMFAMLTLVLADNFLLMFVGWEGVGLCSYLLIGFWYERPAAAEAGKKAFIVNRIGDFGFILGVFVIFANTGTVDFRAAFAAAPTVFAVGSAAVTAAALLLFLGATGKSAQIPLYTWLPDAMEGPTPVSALIHAATMVTAGVYMVARCHAIFQLSPVALETVAVIGAATALFAATIGLAQNDIKRVLAYSTVSQLGYMFMACGVGAYAAGIFHLMTHAFFKALLFLGAGSVIHALSDEQDLRKMGGLASKLPWTHRTMLVATLAIAGIPPFAGFFSKDMILEKAVTSGHWIIWAIGLTGALLTAFYMFRLYILAFRGESRLSHEAEHHLHESPPSMIVPLVVLAVLSAIGGFVGLPFQEEGSAFERWLAPVFADRPPMQGVDELVRTASWESFLHSLGLTGMAGEWLLIVLSVLAAGAGIAFAFQAYRRSPALATRLRERLSGLHATLLHKYWVDELYHAAVVAPIHAGSRALWRFWDEKIVDGIVNGVGFFFEGASAVLRLFQTGFVGTYAMFFALGVLALLFYFVRH
jgi:NADH-quinone oxidoreductase subunit L